MPEDRDETSPEQPSEAPLTPQQGAAASVVDVQQLAEKVYRLMLADARLSVARGERLPAYGRRG